MSSSPPPVSEHTSPPTPKQVMDSVFNDHRADIILRSSDGVHFKMHKSLLSFASSFFEGMFELPQPSVSSPSCDEQLDGLPIIALAESSAALRKLLMFCHPAHAPVLNDLDEIHVVLAPAIKYDMTGIVKRIGYSLKHFTIEEPLRAFCISWQFKLEEETKFAAKNTLNHPMFPRTYVRELELISAATLHWLEEYHYACGEAAKEVSTTYTWITHQALAQFGSGCWKCSQGQYVPVAGGQLPAKVWWTEYMQEAGNALRIRPRGATVKTPELVNKALKKANECAYCKDRAFPEMTEFCEIFAAEVERVIGTISIKLEF
ncbi:hypothetical protein AX16_008118 [Volvariella volvacea WC 439]|nr:hypothetical protein AX16_008118 [Volvariella volvacea WC 439]